MVTWPPESERRWLRALIVLGTFAVALILLGQVASMVVYFSDILIILLLAWLFAFILSPVVAAILRASPQLPRSLVVVFVYAVLFVVVIGAVLLTAGALLTSIESFIAHPPTQTQLAQILAPWQERVDSLNLKVNLNDLANQGLDALVSFSGTLVKPLTDLAIASLGMLGNLVMVVFVSLFIVIDKDRMIAFANRLVPPRWSDEARLFETSVAESFGGFLRGQAIQGVVYGAIAALGSVVLGIDYAPATAAAVAILQMIPFFGPFFSWAPPVVAAVITRPDALLPIIVVMAVGWFVVMNIVAPRVMADSVHIHPVVVLISVLMGLKLQGVVGAIFAIPVAAVISSFFFYYLARSTGGPHDVASRAAARVGQREGRRVRVPVAPPVSAAMTSDATGAGGPTRARSGLLPRLRGSRTADVPLPGNAPNTPDAPAAESPSPAVSPTAANPATHP
jgi:predicted PurR-regulated permease PerM